MHRLQTLCGAIAASSLLAMPALAGVEAPQRAAIDRLLDATPGLAAMHDEHGNLARLYGAPVSYGLSARHTAEDFIRQHAQALGVSPDSLSDSAEHLSIPHLQPVMLDPKTGDYRFTLVSYSQTANGLPVLGSELRILVRNEPGFPAVLVSTSLSPGARRLATTQDADVNDADWLAEAIAQLEGYALVEDTRPAIYVDPSTQSPVRAVETTLSRGDPAEPGYDRITVTLDALNGAELARRDRVHEFRASEDDNLRHGVVKGYATPGNSAIQCTPAELAELPYAKLISTEFTGNRFAEADGSFSLEPPLPEGSLIQSSLKGRYFRVFNAAGAGSVASHIASADAPMTLVHNPTVSDEFRTAEVNAYLALNEVRDAVLRVNPAFPLIADETGFRVNVNLAESCNATYSNQTINFHVSGDCANTAFRTIAYHEYGHRLVEAAGSGQFAYGEGASDAVMYILGKDPINGKGILWDCASGGRDANQLVTYPCPGTESHFCGLMLANSVWQVRENMLAARPEEDPTDTLLATMTSSMLVHRGTLITPQIVIDWLTLDDDNATLADGTPNYYAIAPGFGTRNLNAPRTVCPADFDRDGFLTNSDIGDFVNAFLSQNPDANLNADGVLDFGDLAVFVNGYLAGCG